MAAATQQQREEVERLRANNFRLGSTVQEMQLEISYYKGELKRLEWEKNVLKQDVSKMSELFKGWLTELQSSNTRSVIDDTDYFSNLVRRPALPMERILQLEQGTMLLTTCQAPFFIEYANKAWSTACGWECDEVLGLTCAFLQGECTDLKVAAAFTKDLKEVGYGTMKITNYRKNGSLFSATVHVFPVYDTVSPTGADGDDPVLTHFATVLEDIQAVAVEDALRLVPESVAHCLSVADRLPALNGSIPLPPDRRMQSLKCEVEYKLTSDRFELIGATVRLSDLLRLMLGSVEAMVLTDSQGRILHVNKAWRKLCGYSLSDVEGRTCALLQGPMTDLLAVRRCEQVFRKEGRPASMTVANYRKDGLLFNNFVTIVPIRGGYLHGDVTHYCALLQATDPITNRPIAPPVFDEPFLDLTVDPALVAGELDTAIALSALSTVFKRNRGRDSDTWSEDVEPDVDGVDGVGVGGDRLRDVNYFECEEDEEEEEDLTLRHMPFALTVAAGSKGPALQVVGGLSIPLTGKVLSTSMKMEVEGEGDTHTVDTRYGGGGSLVSGATDHSSSASTFVSSHSNSSSKSSGSTVVLYKESDGRPLVRRALSGDPHSSSHSSSGKGRDTGKDGKDTNLGKGKESGGDGKVEGKVEGKGGMDSGLRKSLTITLPSKLDSAQTPGYSSATDSSSSSGCSSGPASSGSDDSLSTVGMRKQCFLGHSSSGGRGGSSSVETACASDQDLPSSRLLPARKRSARDGAVGCGGGGGGLLSEEGRARLSDVNSPASS